MDGTNKHIIAGAEQIGPNFICLAGGLNPKPNPPKRTQMEHTSIQSGGRGRGDILSIPCGAGADVVDDVFKELHDGAAADDAGAREVAELRGEERVPRGDAIGDDGAEPGPGARGPGDRDAPDVDDLHHRLEVGVPRHRRRHGVAGQLRLRHRRHGATATLPTSASFSFPPRSTGSVWTAGVRDEGEEEIDSSVSVRGGLK